MRRVNEALYKNLRAILPKKVEIFPAIAEEDAKFPFVVYNMNDFSVEEDKDSDTRTASASVEIRSKSFDECDELADLVDLNLRGCIAPGVYSMIEGGKSGYSDSYYAILNFSVETE